MTCVNFISPCLRGIVNNVVNQLYSNTKKLKKKKKQKPKTSEQGQVFRFLLYVIKEHYVVVFSLIWEEEIMKEDLEMMF